MRRRCWRLGLGLIVFFVRGAVKKVTLVTLRGGDALMADISFRKLGV